MSYTKIIHGVRVVSERPIPWGTADGVWDRTYVLHRQPSRTVCRDKLQPEIAAFQSPGHGYSLGWVGDALVLRFFSGSEFVSENDQLWATAEPSVAPELADMLLPNTVLSAVLGAAMQLVLHGSAVSSVQNNALAICGRSGSGKSTLAAVLAANGGRVVSDDALRCQVTESTVTCFRGSCELRLRANAEGIAPNVAPTQERLADGRLGVRGLASDPVCQLRAIWIPVLNAEVDLPHARRLEGTQAFQALLSSLRVLWAPLWMAHLLPQLSHLARIVPLYRVEIPRHILTEPAQQQALVAIAQQHQGSDE